ncbi:hypothetical protein C7S16_4365 [Burkholderia thailandensis]|uniref:Uncharacterized protein n=1 Tax=Burkholderia thailandensis TaxID=57975 RepID=A0AAW9CK71_BURTH|nr:hypothetical protein [Burkholderia thailandensis]
MRRERRRRTFSRAQLGGRQMRPMKSKRNEARPGGMPRLIAPEETLEVAARLQAGTCTVRKTVRVAEPARQTGRARPD